MNKRIAIYTCITGGYDPLKQPSAILSSADYICYIPRGEKYPDNAGIWRIEEFDKPSMSAVINSRYPKMMPHILLANYEYSLYIDANVDIASTGFYDLLEKKINSDTIFSAPKHPFNDCVYDEAQLILKGGKDSLLHILKVVRMLKSNSFPFHWGLYENNVIFRQHNNASVVAADEQWWKLFQQYPKRDQLLLTYCLRQNGINMDYLFPGDECARNSEMLNLRKHPSLVSNKVKKSFLYRKLSTFPKLLLRLYIYK